MSAVVAVIAVVRLELRRNLTLPLLPVLAVLLWVSPYGQSLGELAVWARRSSALQEILLGVGPFMAGAAAWTASRDGRRRTQDLMATTVRSGWRRVLAGWAATTLWGLLFFAAATVVLFSLTWQGATWGGPDWAAVWVGAAGIVASSAVGTALGARFPGRFVAPLAAIGLFLLLAVGGVVKTSGTAAALVVPIGQVTDVSKSVFVELSSGVAQVELLFLGGVTVLALGALALRPAAGGPGIRTAGAVLVAIGAAVAAAGVGLASGGRVVPEMGMAFVPRLGGPATARPIPYTPVCDRSAVQVCVHPAFRAALGDTAAVLRPVTSQFAGVRGGVTRVDLRITGGEGEPGNPGGPGGPGAPGGARSVLYVVPPLDSGGRINVDEARFLRFATALGYVQGGGRESVAQEAVAQAIIMIAGDPPNSLGGPDRNGGPGGSGDLMAAARRFQALSPAARRDWLGENLEALRAGRIELTDLP